MTWTPNVPQGNQQIAATQVPINGDFAYIQTTQQVDHAFYNNAIASQPYGTHQKVSLPTQPTDITSSPTGIASTLYSIGGNLFAYNAIKNVRNAVSAFSGSGTQAVTTTFTTILAIPSNCIGQILISQPAPFSQSVTPFFFFALSGVVYVSYTPAAIAPNLISLNLLPNVLNLQVQRANGSDYTATYKYIYWPI